MARKLPVDKYDLSYGNLLVLQLVPKMMKLPTWRRKLRELVLEFQIAEGKSPDIAALYLKNKK
jgi:hypothetical protein